MHMSELVLGGEESMDEGIMIMVSREKISTETKLRNWGPAYNYEIVIIHAHTCTIYNFVYHISLWRNEKILQRNTLIEVEFHPCENQNQRHLVLLYQQGQLPWLLHQPKDMHHPHCLRTQGITCFFSLAPDLSHSNNTFFMCFPQALSHLSQ